MATPTYDLLASQVFTASTSNITFSNIDQSYRNLVVSVYKNSGDRRTSMRFNGDTGTNYKGAAMQAVGTAYPVARVGSQSYIWAGFLNSGGSDLSRTDFHIFNYSATNMLKSVLVRHNITGVLTEQASWVWQNTSAINSIYLEPTFPVGSTIEIYGLVG